VAAQIREIEKMSKERIDRLYDDMTRDWYHQLRNDYPIFCMSANRGDILQWAHCANAHRGLCIHFDHKRPPFAVALAVRYTDDYPRLRISVLDRGQEAITTMLLRKSSHWTYEKEYRLIRYELEVEQIGLSIVVLSIVAELEKSPERVGKWRSSWRQTCLCLVIQSLCPKRRPTVLSTPPNA
jgi:hypothetical protein